VRLRAIRPELIPVMARRAANILLCDLRYAIGPWVPPVVENPLEDPPENLLGVLRVLGSVPLDPPAIFGKPLAVGHSLWQSRSVVRFYIPHRKLGFFSKSLASYF